MPLKKGSSKKTVSSNIREMVKSPTFAAGKPAKKRREMAAAAALKKAGKATRSKS